MSLCQCLLQLRDLVAPRECAGCHRPGPESLCRWCRARLAVLTPVAAEPGGGAVAASAAGEYSGLLRQCLLGYKERRCRELAEPLARIAARAVPAIRWTPGPVAFVPIPATRRALRERGFDHVGLLCRRLTRLVPGSALVPALRAGPRPDSAGLGLAARRAAATASLRVRHGPARMLRRLAVRVLLVDDIVTSGATLAAAGAALRAAGVAVDGAVTVAATSRRSAGK